jgi:phosphate-selective porin OprO/OprP
MKVLPNLLALAVLAALSAPAFAETEFDVIAGSEISFEGLLQADGYFYDEDVARLGATGGSTAGDGTDTDFGMRRAELVLKGKGPGMWNWVVGYDAKADKFLDTNVSYKFNGFTFVKVGQYKQPNSLEELSSTKNNDFIAKAMTTNLQGVARRVGISAGTGADNWTLTGSAFTRELTRNLGEGNGFGARGTWAPILEPGNYLHLGLSLVDYDARDPGSAVGVVPVVDGDGRARFRVRPDADLTGTRLVDSGQFTDADKIRTAGAEAAWVHGPLKLQGEYMRTNVGRHDHDDYDFDSWYVSGVWNLTGETWTYKDGVVVTGLPSEPTKGMWQLAARYDHVDLNDGSVNFSTPTPTTSGVLGGKESNWTVGVNWYWRSNFKFALNYVKVSSEKYLGKTSATYSDNPAYNNKTFNNFVKDDPSIIEFRAQVYW